MVTSVWSPMTWTQTWRRALTRTVAGRPRSHGVEARTSSASKSAEYVTPIRKTAYSGSGTTVYSCGK